MAARNPYGPPTPAELAHEARIEAAFEELRRLVRARSAQQQARMAWDKGLPL